MAEKARKKKIAEETREIKRIRIARRTMTYIVRTVLLVTLGGILCIAAFLTAERLSNLYILTSEGMSLRADCILADGAKNDLAEYFAPSFIERDAALSLTTYDDYTVSSYDYDLTIERIAVLPWSLTATVTCVERIDVHGSIHPDMLADGESASDYPVPAWTPARYKLHFFNNGTRWYISDIELVEERPKTAPLNTPDPNRSPRPMATPTPVPTDLP